MRLAILLALASVAAAEPRQADQILADHVRALGPAERVQTLVAVSDAGRAWFRLPGVSRRDPGEGRSEWFGPEGAFVRRGGLFERLRPNQRSTRGSFYMMKALAEPFPLLAYLKTPGLLSVAHADGYEVLFTAPDDFGVRAVYLLDEKTHLLEYVRFEIETNRPFATARFTSYRETKGVQLPHVISARFWNFIEDSEKGGALREMPPRDEHLRGWEVDAPLDGIDFVPPGSGGGGGRGFERVVVPVGPDPYDLAAGDLDGDGHCDFGVACEGGVHVRFGGPKEASVFVPLGKGHHHGLAIDDFDADGRLEIVTASTLDPDQTFHFVGFDAERKPSAREFYGAPHFTHALAASDLDRDGLPDVAATGYGSRDLAVRFGNGAGGFRFTGLQWPLVVKDLAARGLGVATGDIDADGTKDIAVANGQRVILFRGDSVSWQPRIAIPEKADPKEPWLPVAVALADLDGDGRDDLLIGREHPLQNLRDDVIVMLNRPGKPGEAPAFVAAPSIDMGERVQAVVAAGFDAAPGLDLAATSFLTGDLVLRPGDGKGGFGPEERFASGRGSCRLALADWDKDGRCDVLVTNRLDDTVSIFLNRRAGAPPPPAREPRAVVAAGPVEEPFELKGLSEPYEFAGEYRLPAGIEDPSGIACLASTEVSDQFVIVSDKRSALFRATLDRATKRLLVGPPIPLNGLENERLDLEAVTWDDVTGNLFLGCEADSTVVRCDLFGRVLGRVKTGIASDGNDGIEAAAFRRLKDGTPLLYVFRERMGVRAEQPPFDIYGLSEDPFGLVPRETGLKLPAPLLDQTDAVVSGDRMFVVSRLSRDIVELRFDGDTFAKEAKAASYRALVDGPLGLTSRKMPLFGNAEGLAIDWNGDLFLLIDNNREVLGVAGKNQGSEGRLLWFRCKGTGPARERPRRVVAVRIVVPKEDKAKALDLLARAKKGEPAERLAQEAGLAAERIAAVENLARPGAGEVNLSGLPRALARLLVNLDVGEVQMCEYDAAEAPEGWSIVWRLE